MQNYLALIVVIGSGEKMSYPGIVTYNCPHCTRPFSVQPTGQAQTVACPSCRGQVTIGPQQPQQLQQPQYQQPVTAPVTPPQQPRPQPQPQQQYQPQPQQQYQQQPQQQYQQQPQQQYQQQPQQQYQPTAQAPSTPPTKSKTPMIIAVVCVVAVVIIALLAYIFVLAPGGEEDGYIKPGSTVTAEELADDWNPVSGQFKGLDDGDTITIRDEISGIEHIGGGSSYYGNVNWTIITFESTGMTLSKFWTGAISEASDIFGLIIFSGNLTSDFEVGDLVDVELTIVDYELGGQTAELPDWYVDMMDASMGYIDFEDIQFQDSSTISHAD